MSKVQNFRIEPDPASSERALVQWSKPMPDSVVSFYMILVQAPGATQLEEIYVDGSATSYLDVLDVASGIYEYSIIPFKILDSGDTVQGLDTTAAPLKLGSRFGFNINHGAVFTPVTSCSLFFVDENNLIRSIRFTQVEQHLLVKDSLKTVANLDNPDSLPTNAEFNTLVNGTVKWITATGTLVTGVSKRIIPVFGAPDQLNPGYTDSITALQPGYPWVLKQGNGTKRVYAEITMDTATDTLSYDIQISPYRVRLALRNSTSGLMPEMVDTLESEYWGKYNWDKIFLYRPWPKFALSINADSTFAVDFDYWLITPYTHYYFVSGQNDSTAGWLETVPRRAQFTDGGGVSHNDAHVYTYSLDTNSAEGRENLAYLKFCKKHVRDVTVEEIKYDIKLTGTETFNECAAPGSYWGATPHRWASGQLTDAQRTISGTPEQNCRQFADLSFGGKATVGFKEFLIAVRMKGKHFNDTRTYLSRSYMFAPNPPLGSNHKQFYFDFYAPKVNMLTSDTNLFIGNGDTVSTMFDFQLDDASVIDQGRSKVVRLELLVAQMPDSMQFDYTKSVYSTGDYPRLPNGSIIDYGLLLSLRHTVIPYPIHVEERSLEFVKWQNIDPSDWPSGRYLFGIVAYDQYGNGGLAGMGTDKANSTNPLLIYVSSGK